MSRGRGFNGIYLPGSQPSSDANLVETWKSYTCTGADSATAKVGSLFQFTGIILLWELHGDVTTQLGAKHGKVAFVLNDATARIYLTKKDALAANLDAAPVGSFIVKKGLVGVDMAYALGSAGWIMEPLVAESPVHSPILVGQKTMSTTSTIEYEYTTNGAAASGVIRFACEWEPVTPGARLWAL